MFFPRLSALALLATSALLGADQALLTLVNPEAKVVGGMNVARTLSSPLGQYFMSKMKADDPGFRDFVNMTGFDPRRDVREVVFSSTADPGAKHAGVVVARGVFNGAQIAQAAQAKGKGTTVNYNGVDLIQHDGGALAVIDGSLLIIGDEANVKGAIDRRSPGALPSNSIFQKASSLMNRYDAWMASSVPMNRLPGHAAAQGSAQMPAKAMQGIIETSGGITFDSIIAIDGEAVTRSEKDAQALMDVVKFVMGMMQMNGANNPKLKEIEPILNSLEMRTEASTVKFSLRVPEADLENLIESHRKPRRRAAVQ